MIPFWYLLFCMAVAYGLGVWIGWTARKLYDGGESCLTGKR